MSIFAGQKVVVTGGAGFLGSHLVDRLLKLDAHVLVVDDLSHNPHINNNIQYLRLDAGNVRALVPAFHDAFAVFNLAARVAGVIYNQVNHLEMYHENERCQIAPVLAAQQAGVQYFLQVSSVCVYAPGYNAPAIEENGQLGEPVAANNGYSWAKRMGERAALWSTIPHPVIVRPSNLYGPRDDFGDTCHVIPKMIRMCLDGQGPIITRGSGLPKREFLYVDDCASGMIAALEHGQDRHIYNIGTGGDTCISMRDLLFLVRKITNTEHRPVDRQPSTFDEGDPVRWSDVTAIRSLGWHHKIDLNEGLLRTAEWYGTRER